MKLLLADASNVKSIDADNSINDDTADHVRHVEAEVFHHMQVIAYHHDANRHVYDNIIKHEQLCIALLPQTTCILQQQWQQCMT